MAEWFVGSVMEKLIEACFECLKDNVGWKTCLEKELKKLRIIHPQIQSLVSAYSQVEIKDLALNKWLWKLRDAIDEADDALDELEYKKREEQMSTNTRKRKIDLLQRALQKDPNLNKLEECVHKLHEISTDVSTFRHLLKDTKQKQQQQQLELHKNRETGSTPANVLLGRSKEMNFVRQWLREAYQRENTNTDWYRKISLLSVVGHGGMGKTTLLQHVYKDGMTEGFDVKIWVCVSTNFDANMVIKNMLESLKKERPTLETLAALQNSLQSEVMSKRFLLVLDDIWEGDETKWGKVLAPLHCASSGSKIFITTRMNSVASKFAKMIKNNQTLQLEGLEKDECLQLFNTHAFAGVENSDDEFRTIAGKMLEKLSGCPLAAMVVGGILNSYMDKSYWTKVLNTNIGNVESSQNGLMPILKLSYIYLPRYLQNCFAFCCIFPQDHKFDRDDLVRMWVALGFVQSSNIQGETLQDTGRRYFNILVQKSFFDKFCTDDKVYYKMHDLLHELAQSVSTQECFKVVDDKDFTIPPETIRHLFITAHSSSLEATFQKMGKLKNLRSLFLSFSDVAEFDENIISEILKPSKSIRVLVIYAPFAKNFELEIIGCLIHLRYLKIECFWGFKLPKSTRHLYHLQFIISRRLQNLEMDKIGWKELKTNENCELIMDALVIKDPSVLLMEPLRSISSFRILDIEENDELVSFTSETEQWFLQHSSTLFRLEFYNLQSLQSLPASLDRLSSLETLRLHDLESLQCLPSSLSSNSSLKRLTLHNIPLLRSLPELPPSLLWLDLEELENLDCLPCCLPTLQLLRIIKVIKVGRLKELPDLPSSLKELVLAELGSLQCLPSCIPAHLNTLLIYKVHGLLELPDLPASLTHLYIKDCHPQLMERFPSFFREG